LQRINVAENKLHQLRVACEVDIIIPETLVTNKAEEAREFFYKVEEKMIAKLLTPLSTSMKNSSFFLYVRLIFDFQMYVVGCVSHQA
jgi:hypothetical protein